MEIRSKKDAVFAAAVLGIEIGLAVAVRSYLFWKDGRDSASLDSVEPEVSLNGDGETSTVDSADLPADDPVEDVTHHSDPVESGE